MCTLSQPEGCTKDAAFAGETCECSLSLSKRRSDPKACYKAARELATAQSTSVTSERVDETHTRTLLLSQLYQYIFVH
jgi:hypothetical protein